VYWGSNTSATVFFNTSHNMTGRQQPQEKETDSVHSQIQKRQAENVT